MQDIPVAPPQAPLEPLETGRTYAGRYRIEGVLGRGAMGTVYRVTDLEGGAELALKVLLPELAREPQALERFRREATILANLDHTAVLRFRAWGADGADVFFVTELIRGGDLKSRLVAEGAWAADRAVELGACIAEGLEAAHALGVVHRDIKPHNILVDHAGNPKLTDFGLAKMEGTKLTQTTGLLGTPMYMSPEQASGRLRQLDARSDIYSLGSVLYEMLTGATPYSGTSIESVLVQIAMGDPVPPRVMSPSVPRDAETICLKAMERMPSRRYATAEEMAEDLERFLKGEPIRARPAHTLERMLKWTRRHRATAAFAVLALLIAVAGGAAVLHFQKKLRAHEEEGRRRDEEARLIQNAELAYQRRDYPGVLSALEKLPSLGPAQRLRRAIALRETGHRERAEEEFARYTLDVPDDAVGWRHRGLNAIDRDDVGSAISWYREAAKLVKVPRREEMETEAAWDVLIAAVEQYFSGSEPQHARPFLASNWPDLFRPAPRAPGSLVDSKHIEKNRYGQGEEWRAKFDQVASLRLERMELWLSQYGEHPILFAVRGVRHLQTGSPPGRSIDDLTRALQLAPINRGIRYYRIFVLRRMKRYEEAEQDWEKVAALSPYDTDLRHNFAFVLKESGDPARASQILWGLANDPHAGRLNKGPNRLILLLDAARCAGQARDASEALRILKFIRDENLPIRKSTVEKDRHFAEILQDPALQEFIAGLPDE